MIQSYKEQLEKKVERIQEQFSEFLTNNAGVEVFESHDHSFRQRVEFRVWRDFDGDKNITDVYYAMFKPGQKPSNETIIRIDDFPIASERIRELMPKLLEALKAQEILIKKLYQVEFLSTLRGDTLITLIYHKKLDDDWAELAKDLQKQLDVHIVGRSRKQKVVLSQDFVTETLEVKGESFKYKQIEGGFTQPNAVVCEKMLTWACERSLQINAENHPKDLLELYCGNGNFTLPLSQYYRKTLATEVAKVSVHAAKYNIEVNKCQNIAIARLSAEEFTEAFTQKREFKRLAQDGIELQQYDFSTIFMDPPRAGVDGETLKLAQRFNNILYVSCNPDTLIDNMQVLKQTHNVRKMALFDQFPFTHHVEMGVWLEKKN